MQAIFPLRAVRRGLAALSALSALAVFGIGANACAQAYPAGRQVRVIVPAGTGSGTDVMGRMFADALSQSTGGKFFIENRAGAGGNIGLSAAAKATPDGYTLVLGNLGANVVNQFIYPSLDFNPEKDFDAMAMIAGVPYVVVVPATTGINSFAELVTAARAKPGGLNVALTGTVVRIMREMFKTVVGVDLFPIPYTGPAPAMADVLSGRIQVLFETLGATTLRPNFANGRIKPLAVTTKSGSELLPGVKSVAEQGYPEFGDFVGWIAFMGPHGVPREAVNVVNAETNKILARPEVRQRLLDLGFEAKPQTPQESTDFIAAQRARFGPLIKAANIKAE